MINKIATLEDKVIAILEKFPMTRNDDTALTFKVIQEYMPWHVIRHEGRVFASLESLTDIREDSVKRVHAKLNSSWKYLPTDPDVILRRKLNIDKWIEYSLDK